MWVSLTTASWRNADLSPLPGEETLHEDVRKWADTNRTAGGSGMQGLRAKYLEEVPEQSRKLLGFNQWLESDKNRIDLETKEPLDIPTFDPENEQGYRGNRESLNRMAPMPELPRPGAEGNNSVEGHRANLRKQKVIGSYLQRYGDESVLSTPMERGEAEAIYDTAYSDALESGENPVLAAGRALHGFSQQFQQNKDSQLRQNVSNRNSQNHRAQRFGVPVGLIAAVDQYRNAGADPARQQQALLMGAMQYPQIFLPIYQSQAYASNQQIATQAMLGDQGGENGAGGDPNRRGAITVPEAGFSETEQGMQNALSFLTVEGFNPEAWLQVRTGQQWLDSTPEGRAEIVNLKYGSEMATVKEMIVKGKADQITPEIKSIMRDMLGDPADKRILDKVFGVLNPGEFEMINEAIYNRKSTTWNDQGKAVRDFGTGLLENMKNFGSGFVGYGE